MPIDRITNNNFDLVVGDMKAMLNNIARMVFPAGDKTEILTVREKAKNDFVTGKDKAVDRMLSGFLEMEFGCPVISEERPHQWPPNAERYLVIDPVDGTHNLGAGWPIFGIMGVYIVTGIPEFSFIYFPYAYGMRREMYVAATGCGAWVMDDTQCAQIAVAREAELKDAFVLFEGPSKLMLNQITRIGQHVGGWRNCISCAVSFASLARDRKHARRTAGVVSLNNKPWDNLPAVPLIREAGGIITDEYGRTITVANCTNVVASNNRRNHRRLLELNQR